MKNLAKKSKLLLHNKTFLILVVTTLFAFLHILLNINSWKFSYTGDEWAFYFTAQDVVREHFIINPFRMDGVFATNPFIGSMYQGLFLFLMGDSNFSWRFSNIILIVPISIFFYLWVRRLLENNVALYSTLFLQCSFFISNYLKIGYVNPQAFALFLACLYIATRAFQTQQTKDFFYLGIVLSLSFYVYVGPLFVVVILPLLLLLKWKHDKKNLLKINFITLIGTYLLLILPGLLDVTHWKTTAIKTIASKEFLHGEQVITNVLHNLFLFYNNNDYFHNHFINGPYLDIVSQIFALAGTLLIIRGITIHLKKEYIVLLATFVMLALVIGVTSPYAYTPVTRGIFFIPFGAVFCGVALSYVVQKYKIRKSILCVFFCFLFLLNVYKSQIEVFTNSGFPATALIIKELQLSKPGDTVLVYQSTKDSFHNPVIPQIQTAYNLDTRSYKTLIVKQPDCMELSAEKILYFDEDTKLIETLPCYKEDVNKFIKLTPATRM